MTPDWKTQPTDFTLPLRYWRSGPSANGTVICLHGFQDHATSMVRRLGWLDQPPPFEVLAINGPFPVPVWKIDNFVEAYSWYFRDTNRNIMLVSPTHTAEKVGGLIQSLLPSNHPVALVGFSQGGFFAPFLAKHIMAQTRAIIGIGCGYPMEAYQHIQGIEVHAIHGEKDERIPIQMSKDAFNQLASAGVNGQYHTFPDLMHRVDPVVEPLVRKLCLEALARSR